MRVIKWATGSMGRTALRRIIDARELTLAGIYVYGSGKAGIDAGTLARRAEQVRSRRERAGGRAARGGRSCTRRWAARRQTHQLVRTAICGGVDAHHPGASPTAGYDRSRRS